MAYAIGEDIAGEEVGDEVGDEVSAEEIGAVMRAIRRRRGGLRGYIPMKTTGITNPYGQPVMAKKQEVDASLYQVFGLGAVTVAAAGASALSQPFIEKFKPGRLLLAETAVGNLVTGIFVGIRPQGANLASMPIAAFAGQNNEVRVAFDLGEIGQPFTVNILTVAAAQTVSGMAFGTTVKQVG